MRRAHGNLLGEAKLDDLGPEVVGWLLSVLPGDPVDGSRSNVD